MVIKKISEIKKTCLGCKNHYWTPEGKGFCKLTESFIKPETCKHSKEFIFKHLI